MALLQDFKEVGLEFLIPANTSIYDMETSEYLRQTGKEYDDDNFWANYNEFSNQSEHDYMDRFFSYEKDFDDEEEPYIEPLDEDDEYDENDEEIEAVDQYGSIGELKVSFDFGRNFEFMDNEEFLQLSIPEFFGITPSQMKFVDFDALASADVNHFVEIINTDKYIEMLPSIEQRIKYATVCAVTGADRFAERGEAMTYFSLDEKEAVNEYIKRIILQNEISRSTELLRLLKDYYRFYSNACALDNGREENERIKYELMPKPSRIRDMHDKASRDAQEWESMNALMKKEATDSGIKFTEELPQYSKLLYTNGTFSIIAPKDSDDIKREGEVLNHCVANYISDFSRSATYLYFLRENNNINAPFFTLEVNSDFRGKNYSLEQCYTYNDTTNKTESCREFIKEWARVKHIKIRCEV